MTAVEGWESGNCLAFPASQAVPLTDNALKVVAGSLLESLTVSVIAGSPAPTAMVVPPQLLVDCGVVTYGPFHLVMTWTQGVSKVQSLEGILEVSCKRQKIMSTTYSVDVQVVACKHCNHL